MGVGELLCVYSRNLDQSRCRGGKINVVGFIITVSRINLQRVPGLVVFRIGGWPWLEVLVSAFLCQFAITLGYVSVVR